MPDDVKVPACPVSANPMESAKDSAVPTKDEGVGSSQSNREKLQAWTKQSPHKSISFWVPPNVLASPDECIAEVASALTRFDEEKKAGKVKPVEGLVL